MAVFDSVDGGIAATFTNGPKQGHVGVVTPDGDMPPKTLEFGNGMIYRRSNRCKVKALDSDGRPVKYKGVAYAIDPQCEFMKTVAREVAAAKLEMALGRVDTL